ncbi:MAG TPA: nuclear transport factor 2 family protein [Devosiaceae bacterium]|jgi:hypothetical protein|nr:nuclear transport factor 2 family protein [Devosiaceae bacterium]
MTDHALIADRYIALWNETDSNVRRSLLASHWSSDARYVDPLMAGKGPDEIDALIAGVQKQFPNFSFRLTGKPDGHGNHMRFSWSLGPGDFVDAPIEGTDFVELADGRIRSVTGFLDRVPQM